MFACLNNARLLIDLVIVAPHDGGDHALDVIKHLFFTPFVRSSIDLHAALFSFLLSFSQKTRRIFSICQRFGNKLRRKVVLCLSVTVRHTPAALARNAQQRLPCIHDATAPSLFVNILKRARSASLSDQNSYSSIVVPSRFNSPTSFSTAVTLPC